MSIRRGSSVGWLVGLFNAPIGVLFSSLKFPFQTDFESSVGARHRSNTFHSLKRKLINGAYIHYSYILIAFQEYILTVNTWVLYHLMSMINPKKCFIALY